VEKAAYFTGTSIKRWFSYSFPEKKYAGKKKK
jgi:hypothetical protein